MPNIDPTPQDNKLPPSAIVDRVCHVLGVPREKFLEVKQTSRGKAAMARYLCIWVLRNYNGLEARSVADLFRWSVYNVNRSARIMAARLMTEPLLDLAARLVCDAHYKISALPKIDLVCQWQAREANHRMRELAPPAPVVKCPHKAMARALAGRVFENVRVARMPAIRRSASHSNPWGGTTAATCAEHGDKAGVW